MTAFTLVLSKTDRSQESNRHVLLMSASRDIQLHKENSTAGNEEITSCGGCGGRRKGRQKASYARD